MASTCQSIVPAFLAHTFLGRFRNSHSVRGAFEIGQRLLQRDKTAVFRVSCAFLDTINKNVNSLPLIMTSRNLLALARSVVMNK